MIKKLGFRGHAVEILHVEDNIADVNVLKEVLKNSGFSYKLNVVGDGDDALDYLLRKNNYSKFSKPDVIILDLKLPGKDAFSIMNEILQNKELNNIRVIVLTGSEDEIDKDWAFRLGASNYIVKPIDLAGYDEIVQLLKKEWLKTFRKKWV